MSRFGTESVLLAPGTPTPLNTLAMVHSADIAMRAIHTHTRSWIRHRLNGVPGNGVGPGLDIKVRRQICKQRVQCAARDQPHRRRAQLVMRHIQ